MGEVTRQERKKWNEGEGEQKMIKCSFFFFKSILLGLHWKQKTELLPDMSWLAQVERAVNKLLYQRPQTELQGRRYIIVR